MEQAIIIKPWLTERSLQQVGRGWFSFMVIGNSTKPQIARAVSEQYKVHVIAVKTLRIHGKTKRVGKLRNIVKKKDGKKALIKLKKGEKIEAFGVENTPLQ